MAIAPPRGHCTHGIKINNELGIKCPWCADEEKQRKDKQERQQQAELNLVKTNLIYLLENDKDFRNQVKKLLTM